MNVLAFLKSLSLKIGQSRHTLLLFRIDVIWNRLNEDLPAVAIVLAVLVAGLSTSRGAAWISGVAHRTVWFAPPISAEISSGVVAAANNAGAEGAGVPWVAPAWVYPRNVAYLH